MMQDSSARVYFSNSSDLSRIIQGLIESAEEEIIVIHGFFSSKLIIERISRAKRRGVKVTVLTNREYAKNFDSLLRIGVEIKFVKGITGILHHKIILIDRKICLLGSCNLHDQSIFDDDENLIELRSENIYDSIKREFSDFDYDLATYPSESPGSFIYFLQKNTFVIASSFLIFLLTTQMLLYSFGW